MIESQSVLTSFWYRACCLMSYLSECFFSDFLKPKLFGPKVFDFNVVQFNKNDQSLHKCIDKP